MNAGDKPVSVLFVCLGNICRSPTAQGVFEALVARQAPTLTIIVDSAGTAAYHVGHPPDERSVVAARQRGIDLSGQRARALCDADFERFDWIVAMDADNFRQIERRCPASARATVRMFMEFAPASGVREVPDPYYGGANGFERVLDLTEQAAIGLLEEIQSRR